MFPVDFCGYRKDAYKDQVLRLQEACSWLGIKKGRGRDYIRLLKEFHQQGKLTRQHILGYNESSEIDDIYRFWRSKVDLFPGLKRKISKALRSGPVLREEEEGRKTLKNQPRNDAFVYFLAGRLVAADVPVICVDGVPLSGVAGAQNADITLRSNSDVIDIECKRPQSFRGLDERVREAWNQIAGRSRLGAVAVDCSAMVRPPGGVLRSPTATTAHNVISSTLERQCYPTLKKHWESSILGFLLFARVPVMTKIADSPVVTYRGEPFRYFQRESISSFVLFNNNSSANPEVLWSIFQQLKAEK